MRAGQKLRLCDLAHTQTLTAITFFCLAARADTISITIAGIRVQGAQTTHKLCAGLNLFLWPRRTGGREEKTTNVALRQQLRFSRRLSTYA